MRIWRVEYDRTTPPAEWGMEMAEDHPRFTLWADSGDGYQEPIDRHIATDQNGQPYWSPPARQSFLSRSGARGLASELESMGVPHRVLRSEPVVFPERES